MVTGRGRKAIRLVESIFLSWSSWISVVPRSVLWVQVVAVAMEMAAVAPLLLMEVVRVSEMLGGDLPIVQVVDVCGLAVVVLVAAMAVALVFLVSEFMVQEEVDVLFVEVELVVSTWMEAWALRESVWFIWPQLKIPTRRRGWINVG